MPEKKPPVKIAELEKAQEKEKPEQGELSYMDKRKPDNNSGKGRSIDFPTVQMLIPVIVSALITILIVFQLAPNKGDFQTLSESVTGLTGSVSSLAQGSSASSARLDTVINSMGEYAKKSDLTSLTNIPSQVDSKLATLEERVDERLADFEATLEELELVNEEGEAVTTDEITRWDLDVYANRYSTSLDIEWDVDPSRIEEEEDYEIDVFIENSSPNAISDGDLVVVLKPRTGDRIQVDEDEVYLDSASRPFYDWDVDVIERSDGTCRRIVFSSDNVIDVPGSYTDVDDDVVPGEAHLRLEFTLEYK